MKALVLILLFSLSLASAQVIDLMAGTLDGADLCSMTIQDVKARFGEPTFQSNYAITFLFYRNHGFNAMWLDEREIDSFEVKLTPSLPHPSFVGELRNPNVSSEWHADRLVYEHNAWRDSPTNVSMRDTAGHALLFQLEPTSGLVDSVIFWCSPQRVITAK